MNVPPSSKNAVDPISSAREEAYQNLSAARHYMTCAMQHLEIADDCGTLYDVQHAKAYFRIALRHLAVPRAEAIRLRSESGRDA